MGARAIVLAAGLGTRLRPLTDERPKPLVPIGDRTVLGHIAVRLLRDGIRSVVVNTHHLGDVFESHLADLGLELHRVHEPVIRGTAGGVAGARALFEGAPIVAWNGDVLADPDLPALRRAAGRGLAFAVAPRGAGEGTVGLDVTGRVVRLRGETFGVEASGGDYLGIAAVGEGTLATLPDTGCLVGDVALPLLRSGADLPTVVVPGPWTDIGTVATYHAENLRWLGEREAPGRSWVHPTASIAPAVTLRGSLLGAGVVVTGAGVVERVVAWPGARVVAPIASAIVTTRGTVVSVA
ncbi:MAG TPA: sugar phosphate nucleotidyltransferase [Polyangiaceae bacterium]|nr:sugar phosphate nucleotidyltransferase [Polyangiaceae bacterium]